VRDDPLIRTDDVNIYIRQPVCGYSAARWAVYNSKFFIGVLVIEFVWKIVSTALDGKGLTWAQMGWIDLAVLIMFGANNAIGTSIAIHNCNKRDSE
jgi:hypothetical protein